MPVITAIKPQKSAGRRSQRFNIFLDAKFGFALSAEALAKAGLAVGQNIAEKDIKKLKAKDIKDKLYNQALRFLSYRPRSEKEIQDYLRKKSGEAKTSQKIIKKLKVLDLINDQAFALWWVEQRTRFRPKGKQALRLELWQRGVDKEIVEAALFSDQEEFALARKAGRKKIKTYQKLGSRECWQKMTAFLARRGFSWAAIKKVLEENEKKR